MDGRPGDTTPPPAKAAGAAPAPPGPGGSSADRPAAEDAAALGATRVVAGQGPESDTDLVPGRMTNTPVSGAAPVVSSRLGDFRLVRKIGQGAMAAVYKARQVSEGREVALKILFKHIAETPKLVERFYREARVLGRLDHPNIVRGHGVGEQDGLHYFAMEYVDGESLQRWLVRLGRLSVGDALHVALACARALEYAHGLEVIHRDIKPDNVLVTAGGVVKVADLGMVKMRDEDLGLTQTGHAVGTPWYMPLEQARNAKEVDGRCDIYALGCMLYHMVVGRPPFSGPTLVDLIREKQAGTFPPARQFNPEVPERLDLVIAKMTAKLVRHRYPNCTEVIRDLEALGLASPSLTFLAAPAAEAPALAETSARTAFPTMREGDDRWYVRYKKGAQVVVRRLTSEEVLRKIESGELGPTARASRTGKDSFRALATFKEFQAAVLGQASRGGADRRTARYRSLYEKIGEQDRQRRSSEQEAGQGNYHYWLGLGLKFGLPAAGVVAAAFFLRWLVQAIQ